MQRLSGRRIAIAGAGTGAGRALAVIAGSEGARIALAARTRTRVERTADLARRAGSPQVTSDVVDFSKSVAASRFFRDTVKALGGLDSVFCLVGGWFEGQLHHQDDARIDEAYRSFLRPVLVINQVAPKYLSRDHWPAIINFSSTTGGAASVRGQTLYNTMKAAVAEVTRSLAADLLHDGIRVNAVLPGAVSHSYHYGREYRSKRRLGDSLGTPEDVAHAALFLASPDASWISGATLPVDGGFHVNRKA